MELNWSTFVLEIINFLVLVWILKRFLYKPVLDVIARRRQGIEDSLAKAESLRTEGEVLRDQYERRLADWERERQAARETLAGEIEEERRRRLAALVSDLAGERERALAVEERRRVDEVHKTEAAAMTQAARFASRLFSAAAGPELERRLVDLLVDELGRLPEEKIGGLKAAWRKPPEEIRVVSAFDLPGDARQRLQDTLTALVGNSSPVRFERDPELLAGARILIGAWVLHANLQDELAAFAEFAHGGD